MLVRWLSHEDHHWRGRAGACRVRAFGVLVDRSTGDGETLEEDWESVDFFEVDNVERPDAPIAPGNHCLVYGPKESGKTTLLFQHALCVANRDPGAGFCSCARGMR